MSTSTSAEEWDHRYVGSDLLWTASPNRFVAEALSDVEPGRALDLAAGESRNAIWLAERGWAVTAVDFSAAGLEKGRKLAAAHGVEVAWVQADLVTWTPPAGRFDAVLITYLHVPVGVLRGVLSGAAGALAAGGLLVVVGHHVDNLEQGVGGPQDPGLLHSPQVIADALVGLDVERAERVARSVETPGGQHTALDALVLARRR